MKEIKEHNPVERRIKKDIVIKNTLRKQLQKDINLVMKWTTQLKSSNNNRIKKRCVDNIKRFSGKIEKNKKTVLNMIDDLEKRIDEEIKVSKTEVKQLQELFKKEYDEMVDELLLMLKVEKGELTDEEKSKISGISIEEFASSINKNDKPKVAISKEFLLAKAQKRYTGEAKDVKDVEKELASEEKDKILFQTELKRMALEKEILSSK
jgi:hypothetical protein